MFYSILHVNHSNSWVTEGNGPFTLGMRRQVSFEWILKQFSFLLQNGQGSTLKIFFSDRSDHIWRSWVGSASCMVPRRAIQKTDKDRNSPYPPQHNCLWNPLIPLQSNHFAVYFLAVLLAICHWIWTKLWLLIYLSSPKLYYYVRFTFFKITFTVESINPKYRLNASGKMFVLFFLRNSRMYLKFWKKAGLILITYDTESKIWSDILQKVAKNNWRPWVY